MQKLRSFACNLVTFCMFIFIVISQTSVLYFTFFKSYLI